MKVINNWNKWVIALEMKELAYFIAVVNYGGFTKASEKIYTSESTLSKSVKKLEIGAQSSIVLNDLHGN